MQSIYVKHYRLSCHEQCWVNRYAKIIANINHNGFDYWQWNEMSGGMDMQLY